VTRRATFIRVRFQAVDDEGRELLNYEGVESIGKLALLCSKSPRAFTELVKGWTKNFWGTVVMMGMTEEFWKERMPPPEEQKNPGQK